MILFVVEIISYICKNRNLKKLRLFYLYGFKFLNKFNFINIVMRNFLKNVCKLNFFNYEEVNSELFKERRVYEMIK